MTRILLRYLNFPALVLLAILGVAVQTSLFATYPFLYLQPDFLLLLVMWAALHRKFTEGGILVLIFGHIAEVHSAAPQGLFLTSYMAIFLMARGLSKMVVIPNLSSLVMTTMGASIAWKFIYMFVLYTLGASANQWRHLFVLLFPGAVMEGVVSIWAYRGLERMDWLMFKNERARKMLDEEMILEGT